MAVLCISSHVAYGMVGGGPAVFALQRLGRDVVSLPTALLSHNPGLGAPRGAAVPSASIAEQVAGLDAVGALGTCEAVLSGYLGEAGTAAVVADAVARVKAARPDALYLCDPVIGDAETGRYVADAVRDAIADTLVPVADVVTPNAFELADLVGPGDVLAAAGRLARPSVVVTGVAADDDPEIKTLVCAPDGAWAVRTPRLAVGRRPDGAGDLLAGLLLARLLEAHDWPRALSLAVSSCHAVLAAGHAAGARAMPVVARQDDLVSPPAVFDAYSI